MRTHFSCVVALGCLLWAVTTHAGGSLRTPFTTVNLHDLPVGRWTRIELADGTRYSVENATDRTLRIGVEAIRPFDAGDKKKHATHAVVPDLSWVKVTPSTLTLKPGETGVADVVISVPDKPEFADRKYRFWVRAKTLDGQFAVGLLTRVHFNTVAAPPQPAPENKAPAEKNVEKTP